jgi:protein ImuB
LHPFLFPLAAVLWIALHLPLLSLESFEATLPGAGASAGADARAEKGATAAVTQRPVQPLASAAPLALMDAQRIVSANAAALALGVKPGLKRATALALAPQLVLGRADRMRDARALEPVAHAALAFTPTVVVPPAEDPEAAPHTVLLEVEASLRYFDGQARLLQRLHAAVKPLGHRFHVASAPTAQGAALLARAEPRSHCADLDALSCALDAVPVWLLGPGREHWDALQGMGLRTLFDLRSLPRAGLARRFGDALLNELDRALGTEPDPRVPIALPPTFESRLELHARADTADQLLYGAGVLLERLVLWLGAQHGQLRRFTLEMRHEPRWRLRRETPPATTLEIALAEPSRDRKHLLVLLRERLGRLQLPAPTLDLVLRADDFVRRAAPNDELFPSARSAHEGLVQLVERLQARLGPEQVQRLQPVADHRPERACRTEVAPAVPEPRSAATRTAGAATAPKNVKARRSSAATTTTVPLDPQKRSPPPLPPPRPPKPRPVWLLPQPEPLTEKRSRPLLDGAPLQLLSGPERIEAGWWDHGNGALAERDYFIAQAADGALVWIYRARLPLSGPESEQGWFLQGRFG